MTTHDTDPQWLPPGAEEGEGEKTSPPSNDTAPDAAFVRELLSDIVRAPLPTEGVASTNGENAAAYEVAPHTPPRARVEPSSQPAMIVNTTQPMGLTPVVAPPAETPSNDRGAPTLIRRRPQADFATDPSEHKRSSRKRITVSVFGVGLLVVCGAIWALSAGMSTPGPSEATPVDTATASVQPAAPTPCARPETPPTAEPTSRPGPETTTSATAAPPAASSAVRAVPTQATPPASAAPRAASPARAPNRTEPAKPQPEPARAAEPKAPPAVVPPPSTASKYIPEERF